MMYAIAIAAVALAAADEVVVSGSQILLLDNVSVVVASKSYTVSLYNPEVAEGTYTFSSKGRTYRRGGKSFWDMEERNRKRYDVLDHVKVEGGKIHFDGIKVEVGHAVEKVYQALRWGDLVACVGLISHVPESWWESDKAHAVIVFSPKEKKGGYLGLTLTGKSSNHSLTLVDPIPANRD